MRLLNRFKNGVTPSNRSTKRTNVSTIRNWSGMITPLYPDLIDMTESSENKIEKQATEIREESLEIVDRGLIMLANVTGWCVDNKI